MSRLVFNLFKHTSLQRDILSVVIKELVVSVAVLTAPGGVEIQERIHAVIEKVKTLHKRHDLTGTKHGV